MDSKGIIAAIDTEISKLKQARAILTHSSKIHTVEGEGVTFIGTVRAPKKRKKRNLTPEGRARIAEAVKRRWAAQKKATK